MKRLTSAKKKFKKQFSKRLHSGYAAAPTKSFWAFKDYARTEIDKKETAKVIREYIRDNFSKEEAKLMLDCPEWCYTLPYYVASTIVWKNLGHDMPEGWNADKLLDIFFADLLKKGTNKEKADPEETPEGDDSISAVKSRSIQDIVSQRSSEFIYEVELVLDEFYSGSVLDIDNYSPYLELKKIDAPYNVAKACYDYYLPLQEELNAVLAKSDKALEEGYSNMTLAQRKEYSKLINIIVDDCDKYMQSKKAVRKIRIAKPLTADKQIKGIKFLKESPEFKLTSINPMSLIGGQRLYTFNAKTRMLTEYVSNKKTGFAIKGTSLLNIDLELSRETRLRKPEEFMPVVMKQTPTKIATEWKNLTTKTNIPNGRINKDTILLRVLDK